MVFSKVGELQKKQPGYMMVIAMAVPIASESFWKGKLAL
jgi:hypothetical protein